MPPPNHAHPVQSSGRIGLRILDSTRRGWFDGEVKISSKRTKPQKEEPHPYSQNFKLESNTGVPIHAPQGNHFIFKHPHSNYKDIAVRKNGWNWFGFFFYTWYLIYLRLWKAVLLHVIFVNIYLALFYVISFLSRDMTPFFAALFTWNILPCFHAGFRTNKLRFENLAERGYRIVASVQAPNGDQALAVLVGLQWKKTVQAKSSFGKTGPTPVHTPNP